MIYSVTLGDKHLFRDFGIYVKTKKIEMPEVQTSWLEIPCRDGLIDLTKAIKDTPTYKNRIITISCKVLSQYADFYKIISELGNYLHGKSMRIVFDDDLESYYYGQLSINDISIETSNASFDIIADCEPYKMIDTESDEPWLWDSFDFVEDYANDLYFDIPPNTTYEASYLMPTGTVKNIIFEVSAWLEMETASGHRYEVEGVDEYNLSQLEFSTGENKLKLINSSPYDSITVKAKWKETRL